MAADPFTREAQIRNAAFLWLDKQRAQGKETFTQAETSALVLAGERVRLMPTQQGIWKPRDFTAALAIRTVYRPHGSMRPYDDDLVGTDGRCGYKMRGTDPNHSDNRALREAMVQGVPLIWWQGVQGGGYSALYPVFVTQEQPSSLQFMIDINDVPLIDSAWTPPVRIDAAYREQMMRQRLHQRPFRAAVLRAYRTSCAVCSFRHGELLDAAHIQEDAAGGVPDITNGLALCKMHHAAYDRRILGITPDYQVEINERVLHEVDGPMLRHGIQDFHGQQLMVLPERRTQRPDRVLLDARYREFLSAS